MKKRQLLYPVLLLLFTACQKDLKPGAGKSLLQPMDAKSKLLSGPFSSDAYKISNITTQYDTGGLILFWEAQTNYRYNTDGTLQNITFVSTQRAKKAAANDSIFTFTSTSTLDFSYNGNTVLVKRAIINSSNPSVKVAFDFAYTKDSLGRWVRCIRKTYNPITGVLVQTATTDLSYNSSNQLLSATSTSGSSVSTETYFWSNGNYISQNSTSQGLSTGEFEDFTYYADQPSQPGDISIFEQQTSSGIACLIPANLQKSALIYNSGTNQLETGTQYAYTFDSKGRVSKGIESANYSDGKGYQQIRSYTIRYVNN